jgi:hypothetical protein
MHKAGTDCRFDEEQFTDSLRRLKREGCNLLVVGSVPDRVRLSAMSRFLGEPTADRRRLVVVTDRAPDRVEPLLPPNTDYCILDQPTGLRASAAELSTDGGTSAGVRTVPAGLGALEAAIDEELWRLTCSDVPGPGQVRLSVDSLVPLLEGHGEGAVRGFVDRVGARVRSVRGMAHYVLPVPGDAEPARAVVDSFDAVVELRAPGGRGEQRWHLPEQGLTTRWVRL